MNLEAQVKRIEGTIERRLNEHTQMAVMLERCCLSFQALESLGGLSPIQTEACAELAREIEALLKKVNT